MDLSLRKKIAKLDLTLDYADFSSWIMYSMCAYLDDLN